MADERPGPAELARACGVHRTTAGRWLERGCPTPRLPDGSLDVAAIAAWARERRSEAARRGLPSDAAVAAAAAAAPTGEGAAASDPKAEHARAVLDWRRARAALAQLELDERAGELLRRVDVERIAAAQTERLLRDFDAMAVQVSEQVAGLQAPGIEAALRAALGKLAEGYGVGLRDALAERAAG